MKFNKSLWIKVHLYLSLFFLPAALIYALTGALYIFDFRENAGATIHEFPLDSPPIKGQEQDMMLQFLHKHNLKIPNDTQVRIHRDSPVMGGITYNVGIIKNKNGEYVLRTIDRSLYGILLLMHKAKGKFYFDIIAVGFAISMIIFYFSGLVITSFCKKNRKEAVIATIIGFVVTALAVWASV